MMNAIQLQLGPVLILLLLTTLFSSSHGWAMPMHPLSFHPSLLTLADLSLSSWTSFSLALTAGTTTTTAPVVDGATAIVPTVTSWTPEFLLQSAVHAYQQALATNALQTQVETGIVLAIIGDAIAQKTAPPSASISTNKNIPTSSSPMVEAITSRPPNANGTASIEPSTTVATTNVAIPNRYNVKRAVSFALFDGVYRAVQHYLYPPLVALCNGHVLAPLLPLAQQSLAPAIEQALVSQVIVIPIVYYPVFFAVTGAVQGLSLAETWQRAYDSWVPLMLRNWLFWIPVQFIVFSKIPDQNVQIPILIACGLIWTIFLSALAGAATKYHSDDGDTTSPSTP
jgi:hypothetical protein